MKSPARHQALLSLLTCVPLLVACQTVRPPTPAAATSTTTVQAAPAWTEGQIGCDAQGRTVLFCRNENGEFMALSAKGHPMYQSQGDRDHTERYLAGNNPWSTTFKPVSSLEQLAGTTASPQTSLEYNRFGFGGMARAVESSGHDKLKHFETSYGLMLWSGAGDDVLDNLLLGQLAVLEIGLEKELNDRSIPDQRRQALLAALTRSRDQTQRLLEEVRALRLDRGDLAADIAGFSFGAAVKGAQWLDHGMP